MNEIRATSKFQRDVKRAQMRGLDLSLLTEVIQKLASDKALPAKNRDHALSGNYVGKRECHIAPDWLLIYEKAGNVLFLARTGSHSDLF